MEQIDLNRVDSPPKTPASMGYDEANRTYIIENELPVTLQDSFHHIGTTHGNPNVRFDQRPFLYRPRPIYPLSLSMANTCQPYGLSVNDENVMSGAALLNCLQSPQFDRSSIGVGSSTAAEFRTNSQVGTAFATGVVPNAHHFSHVHRPQFPRNVSFEGNPPFLYESPDCGYSVVGGNGMMSAVRSDKAPVVYQSDDHGESFICDNVMTTTVQPDDLYTDDGIAPEFLTNSQIAMATCTNLNSNGLTFNANHGPQIHKNFLSIGGNRPVLDKGHNHSDSVAGNNFMIRAGQSGNLSPEQIDGTFLSIKPGGSTGFQPSDQAGGISFNIARDVATQSDIFHRAQADDKLLSLGHNGGNDTWSTNDGSVFNADINSSPFNIFQTPSSIMQHNFPLQYGKNLKLGGCADARCANTDPYGGFHGYSAIKSRPASSTQAGLLNMDPALLSRVAPISGTSVRTNGLGSMQLHQGYGNSVEGCSSEFTDHRLVGDQRYVTGQYQSGQPMTTNKISIIQAANAVHGLADTRRMQPANIGQPLTADKGSVAQDGRGIYGLADKRRRMQIQPDNRGISSLSYQGKLGPSQGNQFAQSAKDVGVAVTSVKPIFAAERSALAQIPKSVTRLPAKRGRIQLTTAAHQILHRKSKPGPSIGPYVPSSNQTMPVYHIRRKDPVEPHHSEKCAICKRDLIFSPTGPLSVPSVRPEVAVLPCRHTFHDECLQRITPKEQAEDPPCIPCAIGGDG
ncbi:uncharacterized protein LOC122646862 isoform X2 [Telopea speciosissima]|uniref:uncharacterized protein LOC122646862 isoform X2 n=1 Tax=Telopea speciosissima TaxID=54955 RepID=UPI001CC8296C|nr:uncharacterized protein LOC122646862 isoform X2 [Telopea speciosissima]